MTMRHGLARTTADLDVLSILPGADWRPLAAAAGQDSILHKTHGVYLDVVTVATYPDSYEDRLTEMYAGKFSSDRGRPRPRARARRCVREGDDDKAERF